MKRGIIVVAVALVAIGISPAAARQEVDCGAFARVQTYAGWGPGVHYDTTVTVVFSPTECSGGWDGETFSYSMSGTAIVYEGEAAEGTPIDERAFASTGSFSDPESGGWPPAWWSCLATADITWEIPGVYSFRASAADGDWTLDVSPPDVHWTHSAC